MRLKADEGKVVCPVCKGDGCKMCIGTGRVYKTVAELYLELLPTCEDADEHKR